METVPPLCIGCRFGTVIPACIAAEQRSVFWCRQGVPRQPDRQSCPCFLGGDGVADGLDPSRVIRETAVRRRAPPSRDG